MLLQRLLPVVVMGLLAVGCATPQKNLPAQPLDRLIVTEATPATAADLEPGYRYRLSYGDQIDVRFLRQLDYSTTVVVGFDGTIKLPFLESVRVEGMTIDEAEADVEERYAELIQNAPKPDKKLYLLGPNDVLEIKFPYVQQYSTTVVVRPDGRISLPLVGAIVAEGKSPGTLQQELVSLYQNHLENPELALNLVQAASSTVVSNGKRLRVALPEMDNLHLTLRSGLEPKVYVGGEVNAPQAMLFQPMMTSLQAIMAAGGTNGRSQLASVVILRKGVDGGPRYIVRDLAADIDGDETSSGSGQAKTNDILLRPFDVIIVPKTAIASVSDALNAYVYDVLPMLRNISLGFNYQLGTTKIKQDTRVTNQTIDSVIEAD
ncbi:MAG: polysaccharide biosynthesis/export family protein [Halioglobus sp.]